jgi:thiamine transporter
MKKNGVVATMAEIAIFSALGYVLDTVASLYSKPLFLNGGSIGIAMACIFFIAFRRGLLPGLATGLILGLLQLVNGVYVAPIADTWWKAFAQIALDYWLAYPVVGFAGLLHHLFSKGSSKKVQLIALISGCVLGGLLKFLCHFLSGVIFWPDDAWNVGSSALYSFL